MTTFKESIHASLKREYMVKLNGMEINYLNHILTRRAEISKRDIQINAKLFKASLIK